MSRSRARLLCGTAELAVESARAAEEIALAADPLVLDDPIDGACTALGRGERVAVAILGAPSAAELLRLGTAARNAGTTGFVALVGSTEEPVPRRDPRDEPGRAEAADLAADLGLVAVDEVRPLVTALAVDDAPGPVATAALRGLSELDRARLFGSVQPAGTGGRLVPLDGGRVAWLERGDARPHPLGRAEDLARALRAFRRRLEGPWAERPEVPGLDPTAVEDVLLGPPRGLSDPASKAALAPYGVPLPDEELCGSPSRAAAEAGRLGFPVRMSLASPDLRLWDHPDLVLERVDSASRAKEGFRQLTALARLRSPEARVLGVTVTAAQECHARMAVRARSLAPGRVVATAGFDDPHGAAAGDLTWMALPVASSRLRDVLRHRLRGGALLTGQQGPDAVAELADLLVRLAAFVDDRRDEVDRVELRPVTVLMDGSVEVREARVTVGDAYERRLRRRALGTRRGDASASGSQG
ncbi:MAG TPA: acetate--CoA ligase family protein [Polyangiaceae bacterium LLY-WYZ-14_1]|nr:acetate--CoA ligase family protein [Polyangiaceae bacterium LLY-WYZ-14_1]